MECISNIDERKIYHSEPIKIEDGNKWEKRLKKLEKEQQNTSSEGTRIEIIKIKMENNELGNRRKNRSNQIKILCL